MNALYAIRGNLASTAVLGACSNRKIHQNFGTPGILLHDVGAEIVVCRLIGDVRFQRAIRSADRSVAFLVLAARRKGVFIARLREDRHLDHALVVQSTRGHIIDTVDHHCFK